MSIRTFQRCLTVWVLLCMAVGVLIGRFLPGIPAALDRLQISGIAIPIAVLIWVMIYPMRMKADFRSVKQIGRNPKGLFVTWVANWPIKPFTMYAIASLFFFCDLQGLHRARAGHGVPGRGRPAGRR